MLLFLKYRLRDMFKKRAELMVWLSDTTIVILKLVNPRLTLQDIYIAKLCWSISIKMTKLWYPYIILSILPAEVDAEN